MSLRQVTAGAVGVAKLTEPSLNNRLHHSCDYLAAIMNGLFTAKGLGSTVVRGPGRCLHLVDGTCVSKPGSKGKDWRIHNVYDLGGGGFTHLEVSEALGRGKSVGGELRIANSGDFNAKAMRHFAQGDASQNPCDFIVLAVEFVSPERSGRGKSRSHRSSAEPRAGQEPRRQRPSVHGAGAPWPLRLVSKRKPPEIAQRTRKKLWAEADKKNGKSTLRASSPRNSLSS